MIDWTKPIQIKLHTGWKDAKTIYETSRQRCISYEFDGLTHLFLINFDSLEHREEFRNAPVKMVRYITTGALMNSGFPEIPDILRSPKRQFVRVEWEENP